MTRVVVHGPRHALGTRILVATAVLLPALLFGVPAFCVPYGFLLHATPAGYGGCGIGPDDATLTCGDVLVVGDATQPQFVWVLAHGWPNVPGWPAGRGLSEVHVGIAYEAGVRVSSWTACAGGLQIPQDDPLLGSWPESRTAITVGWPGGEYVQPNAMARIGFLVVDAGSSGLLRVVPDGRRTPAAAVLGAAGSPLLSFDVPASGWSVCDVSGDVPALAYNACSGDPLPARNVSWSRVKALY